MGEEIDYEISYELWTKISNLALNQNTFEMVTIALKCLEFTDIN